MAFPFNASPLALSSLILCALVGVYACALIVHSLRVRAPAPVRAAAKRLQRALIVASLLTLGAQVAGMISLFGRLAQLDYEHKSAYLAQGLDRLLIGPAWAALFAGTLGLLVLRARASYLEP